MNNTLQSKWRGSHRDGFTLVEMLVAMAVTLLIMGALARSFGYVGRRVQDSRGDVNLSNQLRDVQIRLNEDLAGCTVSLDPLATDSEKPGYFVYYEGPMTDVTSSLFRATPDPDDPTTISLADSRYGDFDDYLAFTAIATGDNWFTGKVPRYLLDMKEASLLGTTYTLNANSFDPVVIRSKHAEIVYFASPEYEPVSLPAAPRYIDVDGDADFGSGSTVENGLPDRIKLHRRVLLIRPDLNITSGALTQLPVQSSGSVPFMQADNWPNANTATIRGGAVAGLGWLYGMAGVHQQCDLSLRRVMSANGAFTSNVAANSLADLTKPENRFAHVRIPGSVLFGSGGVLPTSMPVLALGGPATILNATAIDGTRLAPPATPTNSAVVTPTQMSGFLRPEFVLGNDLTHLDVLGDSWGVERIGEDLLTNNLLGFDLKVYDPGVSVFTTGNSLAIGPNDAGYREVLTAVVADNNSQVLWPRTEGEFVDLAYPTLAGGALRGWQPRYMDRLSNGAMAGIGTTGALLITPFSGIGSYSTNVVSNVYQRSLLRSGKLVATGTQIRLYQPTFDTFTDHYERDGSLQAFLGTNPGTVWGAINAAADAGADGIDTNGVQGADDRDERETLPPFTNYPEAIRISIRVENTDTRQIQQISATHRDQG